MERPSTSQKIGGARQGVTESAHSTLPKTAELRERRVGWEEAGERERERERGERVWKPISEWLSRHLECNFLN
jgi:hypothetical protein